MALTAKGEPNGLATLDADGLLPPDQLPTGMGAQAAAVADQSALTATAPAALTASAPAALTGAAAVGTPPTKTEYDKTVADVVALRTTLAAAVVDLAALRTPLAAAIVDLGVERTKLNALLASLRTAGLLHT